VLLDDSKSKARADAGLFFSNPERILLARAPRDVPSLLEEIQRAQGRGKFLAGWIAYEAGLAFHPTLAYRAPGLSREPLAWIGVFPPPRVLSSRDLENLMAAASPGGRSLALSPSENRRAFARAFRTIRDYIAAGDVYQVNHTFRLAGLVRGSVLRLYADLRRSQPVPYGAYIDTGSWKVISLSPELFLQRRRDEIVSKPMKGTAPAGRTWAELLENRSALARDGKNRAENLMITDLVRNDISRVARPGSVGVRRPFHVEKFGRVLQMTSEIRGTLKAGTGFPDIFRALFPCGSITGAPKVRAMEIIAETESAPRGVYTGALGFFAPGGDFTLNIPIRTLVLDRGGHGHFGTGSGIVADSAERDEYEECLLKSRFLSETPRPFALIETLLWRRGGGFAYLDLHMARLSASARFFDFALDENAARAALAAAVRGAKGFPRLRVRVTCDRAGRIVIERKPYRPPRVPVRVAFAKIRVDSTDPFLFHKTTRRDSFERALCGAARKRPGIYDCLLLNERKEVTEGTFNNVFVPHGRGLLATPPVPCGLLPGVLRRHLVETGEAVERPLSRQDIQRAKGLFLGNSVSGLMAARLV